MDKKTYTIGVLSIISAVLLAANLMPTPVAEADTVIKDRDYTLATTRGQKGGETLYVIDNRTGQIGTIAINNRQLRMVAADTLTNMSK
ncbi:MAG TPA: hypothetical protein VF595_07680 [Tepidisphaeraceae bacterium]|jgi:hypothetical protein